MAKQLTIHFTFVDRPLWNKTSEDILGPEEVKFHAKRRNQEIFIRIRD